MRLERLGEKAVILRDLPCPAFNLARFLNDVFSSESGRLSAALPAGFEEAVASYETVGLYFGEAIEDAQALRTGLESLLPLVDTVSHAEPRHLELPICYEMGEDLQAVSGALKMSAEEVIRIHSETNYRCYAVGFSPGFAYLGYLDGRISGLPRLSSPRKRVEPGSLGITGRQTAVYPSATPGGWNLIGRCPLNLVDVEENYFPIEAGDMIAFRRIDEFEFQRLKGERL